MLPGSRYASDSSEYCSMPALDLAHSFVMRVHFFALVALGFFSNGAALFYLSCFSFLFICKAVPFFRTNAIAFTFPFYKLFTIYFCLLSFSNTIEKDPCNINHYVLISSAVLHQAVSYEDLVKFL